MSRVVDTLWSALAVALWAVVMARVELVMLDPATLTERLLQQDDLNL